jgi:hypothetical protein
MYRIHVDQVYNCRPKKGERKSKDGRLVKCLQFIGDTIEEAKAEARSCFAASEKIAPGYAAILEVRVYTNADWIRNCLTAVPIKVSTTI